MYLKEACIETLNEALMAQRNGADLLELCVALEEDGLSPPEELIQNILNTVKLPVKVMVRSRPGNFIYTGEEIKAMVEYIDRINRYNIAGYVFGALKTDLTLDIGVIKKISNSTDKPITIHKCIDLTPNPLKEISRLKKIPRVSSILTSGKQATAAEGIELLRKMVRACGSEIDLIVAGKVTDQNIDYLHNEIGAHQYHGRRIVGIL